MVEGVLPTNIHQLNSMENHPTSTISDENSYNKGKGKKKSYHLVNTTEKWITHHFNVGEG